MRRARQIALFSTSFLAGVVIAANFKFDINTKLFILIILFCLVALLFVKNQIGYVVFIVLGLVVGLWRFEYYWQNKLPSATRYEDQKVIAEGIVYGEPRWDEYKNYVFYIDRATVNGSKVDGLIRIKTMASNIKEGQKIKASGKVKVGQGKASTYISYATVEVINKNQPLMFVIKQAFYNGLNTALPQDSAAFMSGILIGSRSALSKSYTDILTTLGLSHIVAVSGYNLTILVGFLNRRFIKNWRWASIVASLWIVLGFVIIAGASASILRAGIMSAIFLIASYYGKRLNIIVCMSLVAVVMVAIQPQSIISDVGWQLSFLSLLGITVLSPKISSLLPQKPTFINDILSVTLAAQLATAGLVMYKFGQLSLLAPLSNLIIMPAIPVLMLLGFVSALLGLLLPSVAYLFWGKYIDILVSSLFDLLTYMSHWSFAIFKTSNLSIGFVAIYYVVIIIGMLIVRDKANNSSSNLKNDKILPDKKPTQINRKELNSVRS